MSAPDLALCAMAVSKRYGRIQACEDVSIEVRRGEVHALIGENGAGKSTLAKIFYGMVRPDSGAVEIDGRRLSRSDPAHAISLGAGMVFQHFQLVGRASTSENVYLGIEPRRRGVFLDRAAMRRAALELGRRHGLEVDPDAEVRKCAVGIQQRVEILKCLARGARTLILDEPTALLSPHEIEELLSLLRRLAEDGRTILLVTHRLPEVMAAADRVTVLREGRVVSTLPRAEVDEASLAEQMIGHQLVPPEDVERVPPRDEIVLELEDARVGGGADRDDRLELELAVHAGEIVGVAGVEGNGQSELIECLAGVAKLDGGAVVLAGENVTHLGVRERIDRGLAHIPADRLARGILPGMSLAENLLIGSQWTRAVSGRLGLDSGAIRTRAERLLATADVRPADPDLAAGALSGGNQQKLVIARELDRRPRALLAAHPTRGLDLAAASAVREALRAERDRGVAVLLVSSDLEELLELADRIVVMRSGRITGEIHDAAVSARELGLMMTGGSS